MFMQNFTLRLFEFHTLDTTKREAANCVLFSFQSSHKGGNRSDLFVP